MFELVNMLGSKMGLNRDILDDEVEILIRKMKDKGIVYERKIGRDIFYRLCKNVKIIRQKDQILFEVIPNSYLGVFFDYCDIFECVSEDKYEPEFYYVAYAFNPSSLDVQSFGLGSNVRIKLLARGFNEDNEGILVKLPNRELAFFELDKTPCITIGLSEKGRFRNTSNLNFNEIINNKFIEGKKGICIDGEVYYRIKDINVNSKTFSLTSTNHRYSLQKKEEIRLFSK